jgi:uncharacterized protein (TIGR02996 family)
VTAAPFLKAIECQPSDALPWLIYSDWLDEQRRAIDAALIRVLLDPASDRHRLDYAGAVEADGRVAAWREAKGRKDRLIVKGFSVFRSPAHDTEFERAKRAEAELRRTAEHAAARAEFVRVQCELARYDAMTFADCPACEVPGEGYGHADDCPNSPRHPLRRRERELWDKVYRDFDVGAIPGMPLLIPEAGCGLTIRGGRGEVKVKARRGFVASITLPCADLLAHAGAVFACQPVERVVLSGRSPGDFEQACSTVHGLRDRWRWYTSDDWHGQAGHVLPAELFRRLNGSGRWKNTYPTAADARADLSAAAVALGRDLARLPPLPAGAAGR